MKCSHDHVRDHDADKTCDADMMNYVASLMKGKGKGYFGKRHGPMDVDEGKNMKCYHCGEFGHRKSQCPVLDRIMNEWRSEGGGKDKGKGKCAWKGDCARSQWSSGWKGHGWKGDAHHHGHGKAKGKGDKGKGKGLYALDGPPSAEASWWDDEVAFGLFDKDAVETCRTQRAIEENLGHRCSVSTSFSWANQGWRGQCLPW